MSKANKVEVQKGANDARLKTQGTMTHHQAISQKTEENALRRSGQTLTWHEPKTSRK
ncbi:MAG TPA: hypothetical protein VIJ14_08050 [Rhabdochlamydiaceae bacterium]